MVEEARRLLAGGGAGDKSLRSSANVGRALAVRGPNRELHSWFVPLTVGDRLAAFFQFLPDATLLRFSSFQRRPNDCSSCPPVADWLDAERIKSRAESHVGSGETMGEPFLSYDRTPDRLVWAVPFGHEGAARLVYVVGDTVYSPPTGDTFG